MLPVIPLKPTFTNRFVAFGPNTRGEIRATASPRLPPRKQRVVQDLRLKSGHKTEPKVQDVPKASLSGNYIEPSTGGGSINGGGNDIPPVFTAEDSGGNFFEENPLVDALVKGGVALSELPVDLQAAIKAGLLSMKDIHHWLAISSTPFVGALCRAAPAIRDRLMGNPRFLIQIAAELAVGLSAKAVAEMKARGDRCFKEELPFFLSDMALEAIADIALVSLLSPKRSFKPLPSNAIARSIAKLPGHALQKGTYSVGQRAFTVLYRGAQFFLVGFMTSMVGHSITKWAVENQPGPKEDVNLAPVLDNSLGFGYYMTLSSNTRYQTVNCLEDRFLAGLFTNKAAAIIASVALRFSNCYIGSEHWLMFAKSFGLQ